MTEPLADVKNEMHKLGLEIAGLRPIVLEVHSSMPRIVLALETLAGITVRMEANTEDHRHIHERISAVEESIKGSRAENMEANRIVHHRINETDAIAKEFKDEFDALRSDHIVCTTTQRISSDNAKASPWTRLREKFTDKALELTILAILFFLSWMVLSHLSIYPPSVWIPAALTHL